MIDVAVLLAYLLVSVVVLALYVNTPENLRCSAGQDTGAVCAEEPTDKAA